MGWKPWKRKEKPPPKPQGKEFTIGGMQVVLHRGSSGLIAAIDINGSNENDRIFISTLLHDGLHMEHSYDLNTGVEMLDSGGDSISIYPPSLSTDQPQLTMERIREVLEMMAKQLPDKESMEQKRAKAAALRRARRQERAEKPDTPGYHTKRLDEEKRGDPPKLGG